MLILLIITNAPNGYFLEGRAISREKRPKNHGYKLLRVSRLHGFFLWILIANIHTDLYHGFFSEIASPEVVDLQ